MRHLIDYTHFIIIIMCNICWCTLKKWVFIPNGVSKKCLTLHRNVCCTR